MPSGSPPHCSIDNTLSARTSRLLRSLLKRSRPIKRRATGRDYRFTHQPIAWLTKSQIPVGIACCMKQGGDTDGCFATAIPTTNIVRTEGLFPKNPVCRRDTNHFLTGTDVTI